MKTESVFEASAVKSRLHLSPAPWAFLPHPLPPPQPPGTWLPTLSPDPAQRPHPVLTLRPGHGPSSHTRWSVTGGGRLRGLSWRDPLHWAPRLHTGFAHPASSVPPPNHLCFRKRSHLCSSSFVSTCSPSGHVHSQVRAGHPPSTQDVLSKHQPSRLNRPLSFKDQGNCLQLHDQLPQHPGQEGHPSSNTRL